MRLGNAKEAKNMRDQRMRKRRVEQISEFIYVFRLINASDKRANRKKGHTKHDERQKKASFDTKLLIFSFAKYKTFIYILFKWKYRDYYYDYFLFLFFWVVFGMDVFANFVISKRIY